jgi:ankyrin repeat protein
MLGLLESEELLYKAVRQGHTAAVQVYLDENPQCVNRFFDFHQCRGTLLITACYYKHETMVRMLLTRFKPDLEAPGTVVLDDLTNDHETFEGVSALWIAAAVDHFEIVRLLIEQGRANVNYLTKTHSTALREACYNNNLQMIKYLIKHGADPHQSRLGNYTNLMLSAGRCYLGVVIYLVDELKCDLNERDENGEVALHYAVTKSVSLEIVKYLLDRGAMNMHDTSRNATPLMQAVLRGHVELIEPFRAYCSDLEWIECKELLGATFTGLISSQDNPNKTVQYLREAFALRKLKNLPKELIEQSSDLFEHRRECVTVEEFNQLLDSNRIDALRIETIRIFQRLLGDKSDDYIDTLRVHGAILADDGRYVECVQWWLYTFELEQKNDFQINIGILQHLLDVFRKMEINLSTKVSLYTLQRTLNIIDREVRSNHSQDHLDRSMITLLYTITNIGHRLQDERDSKGVDDLRRSIQSVVARQYRTYERESSLLHLCCNRRAPACMGGVDG